MLICNNGNVDKEGYKMFRTKKFVEADGEIDDDCIEPPSLVS